MKKIFKRISSGGGKFLGLFIATIMGGVMTATALAVIPDANGLIHSCYSTGLFGSFKIIDTATTSCGSGQTALNWKQNGSPLKGNLVGANFTGASMVNWDLSSLNLSHATFNAAILSGAILSGATITGASFSGATLTGADMHNMNLNGYDFTNAIFGGTNLSGSDLRNAHLQAIFDRQTLDGFDLSGAVLSNASFNSSSLNGVRLSTGSTVSFTAPDSSLKNDDFSGDLIFIGGTNINFNGSKFIGAHFGQVDTGFASIQSGDFTNTNLTNAAFDLADLRGSTFTGATLTGATWGVRTVCPDGSTAGDNGNTCIGHLVP